MKWVVSPSRNFPSLISGVHPLVNKALYRRGLVTSDSARAFLDRSYYSPASPSELPGLDAITERLLQAIKDNQRICVWGDFDADGQTSTAILFGTLCDLGADTIFHIPVRAQESHGVNIPHLQEAISNGAEIILTCDTGISANAATDYANNLGVDVLITDHHDLPDSFPNAYAITDPKLLSSNHPLFTLSGSGIAYKLAEELYRLSSLPDISTQYLDLAAIGLVADLATLTGDARYIVQSGLDSIRQTNRLGLQTMLEIAELSAANVTEEHIGFVIGPRLNALGRLADASPAVELFNTRDPVRARVIATQLEGLNTQRQLLCSQVIRAAEGQLQSDPSLIEQPVLVLGHSTWPGGVVGIVASHLVEKYHKPTILFSMKPGESAHGSARSVDGLNITAAISAQKDLLLSYGGHPMAAGLSLDTANIPEFRRRLGVTIREMSRDIDLEPTLEIDSWLNLSEINLELVNAVERLAPFGPGNPKLTFASKDLNVRSVTPIGRNREHLKLQVIDNQGNSQTVLWWNAGDSEKNLPENIDLAYNLRAADWRGNLQVQTELVDFRMSDSNVINLEERHINIIDYRKNPQPLVTIDNIKNQPSVVIWAEGQDNAGINGLDRYHLFPAEKLVIWTTPPSLEILRSAMEMVKANTVYLFAYHSKEDTPEDFVTRLASYAKYAINHRSGKVSLPELETALAQRIITVRAGIDWLVAQGKIYIKSEENDVLFLKSGDSIPNSSHASLLWSKITALLSESNAYRDYFKNSAREVLFEF